MIHLFYYSRHSEILYLLFYIGYFRWCFWMFVVVLYTFLEFSYHYKVNMQVEGFHLSDFYKHFLLWLAKNELTVFESALITFLRLKILEFSKISPPILILFSRKKLPIFRCPSTFEQSVYFNNWILLNILTGSLLNAFLGKFFDMIISHKTNVGSLLLIFIVVSLPMISWQWLLFWFSFRFIFNIYRQCKVKKYIFEYFSQVLILFWKIWLFQFYPCFSPFYLIVIVFLSSVCCNGLNSNSINISWPDGTISQPVGYSHLSSISRAFKEIIVAILAIPNCFFFVLILLLNVFVKSSIFII